MADSLLAAAKAVLDETVEDSGSVDPELLEEHQEQLGERMAGEAGGCLHASLAADALRTDGDAADGAGDTEAGGPGT